MLSVPQLPEDRPFLAEIFRAALAAADPYYAVLNAVSVENNCLTIGGATYDLASFKRILVIGAGKATSRMAQAIESLLGSKISAGLITVKDGHALPLRFIGQVEAAHPVPNEAAMTGTQRIRQLLQAADASTLVICLLSGGASALLIFPAKGITLQDKQQLTQLLLNAGASIAELNTVRKHVSAVKGGQLAEAAYPAQLLTLIVSDVIGDQLDVIASGPTAADETTFSDAWSVIMKYALLQRMPANVADYLQRGIAGLLPETVKIADPCLAKTCNWIIASLHQALMAAKIKAEESGFHARIITDILQGEARDAAHGLAQCTRDELARMHPGEQRCLLFGGETTVTVRGAGHGGRNQELALAFALDIEGCHGISLLSAGTDGTDGPTDAAGAIVDGDTVALARRMDIEAQDFLENNDSYGFFKRLDAMAHTHSHLKTEPTGTNVMDIQIILLQT